MGRRSRLGVVPYKGVSKRLVKVKGKKNLPEPRRMRLKGCWFELTPVSSGWHEPKTRTEGNIVNS